MKTAKTKRLLSIILSTILGVSAVPMLVSAESAPADIQMGDVDQNGVIDIGDAMLVLAYSTNFAACQDLDMLMETDLAPYVDGILKYGDVCVDEGVPAGTVDLGDAYEILQLSGEDYIFDGFGTPCSIYMEEVYGIKADIGSCFRKATDGDVNGDGYIDSNDATIVLAYATKVAAGFDEEKILASDIGPYVEGIRKNGDILKAGNLYDGYIDASDAAEILKIAVSYSAN